MHGDRRGPSGQTQLTVRHEINGHCIQDTPDRRKVFGRYRRARLGKQNEVNERWDACDWRDHFHIDTEVVPMSGDLTPNELELTQTLAPPEHLLIYHHIPAWQLIHLLSAVIELKELRHPQISALTQR
jgi:hypothetical protein